MIYPITGLVIDNIQFAYLLGNYLAYTIPIPDNPVIQIPTVHFVSNLKLAILQLQLHSKVVDRQASLTTFFV